MAIEAKMAVEAKAIEAKAAVEAKAIEAKTAVEAKATGNLIQPDHEPIRPPVVIRPGPEPNRLDARLRISAYFLMVFGSCLITNSISRASGVQDMVFLVYALFLMIFGAWLLFMSVMIARSPFATTFAAFVVRFIHNFIFGDA